MSEFGTPELIAVGAVFAVVLILVAIGGTQVVASAGRANEHLANAATLGARAPNAGSEVAPGGAAAHAIAAGADDSAPQTVAQLTQYYAANLSQGQAIFWASFVAMLAGFAIVFAGIVSARANTTTAIVGAIAGVLSQFIAATFLAALRSTQAQSTSYAQTLVELRLRDLRAADDAHATQLGLELLGAITGDGASALMNQTRAALAMGLIVKQVPAAVSTAIASPLPADDDDVRQPRNDGTRVPSVTFDAPANAARRRVTMPNSGGETPPS